MEKGFQTPFTIEGSSRCFVKERGCKPLPLIAPISANLHAGQYNADVKVSEGLAGFLPGGDNIEQTLLLN